MGLNDLFKSKKDSNPEPAKEDAPTSSGKAWVGKEIGGKIIKLDDGWGFIESDKVPYTRIFFHWTFLLQDTLHFTELKRGMRCVFILAYSEGRGYSAVRLRIDTSQEYTDEDAIDAGDSR